MADLTPDLVTITTEYDLITQDRLEGFGEDVLALSDEQAGQWIKTKIRQAVESAKTDPRVIDKAIRNELGEEQRA